MLKFINVLFILSCSYLAYGQIYLIQQTFDNGNTLPAEWELQLDSPYTSASNSGSSIPALKFSATGHYLRTPSFYGATDVSFWLKGISTDTLSTFVVEGWVEGNWTEIQRIRPISRTAQKYQLELPDYVTRLQFTYIKSSGNVAFDDLIVSRPSRPPRILNCRMTAIKDYTAEMEITLDTSGIVAYLVVPDTVPDPHIHQLLHLDQYTSHTFADTGHIRSDNNIFSQKIFNLVPSSTYCIYLLPTGSKNNINDSTRLEKVTFTTLKAQPTLFFSAIVKGTGNNKIIAIYNPTSDTVKLSEYRIAMSTNGGGWLTSYFTFKPSTLLPPHSQYIIMKSTADSLFKASFRADTLTGNKVINFTGNDARALQRTVNNGNKWFTIDVYGLPTQATDFSVAGIAGAAGKYNLYRKRNIHTGNTSWQLSTGTDSLSSEWLLKPLTDFNWLLEPFAKTHRKLVFRSLSFANLPVQILVDTLQQQIYVTFPDTVDLKQIHWQITLDSGLVIVPNPMHLHDFSNNFSFYLIDTLQLDTCAWTFRIKTLPAEVEKLAEDKQVIIFPNPVKEWVQIHGISNDQIREIIIFSSTGKIIGTYQRLPIQVSLLSPGSYLLKIYLINNKSFTNFFVKTL